MVGPAPAPAPVVVVLDASPATDAVRWTAREAARRRVPLRILAPAGGPPDRRRAAVVDALATARRAAPRTAVDLGVLTGDRTGRWDAADASQRQDLADRLSLAAVAHPGVPVRQRVVDDSCADLLADLAVRARLLVLGRPARGDVLGRVRPSPAAVLARLAPCPVAVVPPTTTPRSSLLPERRVGVGDLRS